MKAYFLLVALCLAFVSCQQDSNYGITQKEGSQQASLDAAANPDAEFARKAAEGGIFEVQLGNLAQSRGMNMEVKNFGQRMTEDHGKANEELKNLAQKKNIELPTALDEKKQKKYDDLAEKSGSDFDKAYLELMVEDHKEDIDLFEKEVSDGKDADLKNWASAKLPTLKHHLQMAQDAQDALKNMNQ